MKEKLLYKMISACILLLLTVSGTLSGQTGNTQSTAIDLGSKSGSFTYTDTKNTSSYTNNYTGRSTNDVYYKFTTTVAMDITISHCGSAVSDTYVHLLNSSGGFVALNDDYDGEGHCSSTFNSYLKKTSLAAGTYYVVSEGYSQNGNITTTIQGTVQKVEYDLGSKSGSFTYTHTQNTANCFNSYTGRSTNDVHYKFTTTVAMDITISHCGSAVSDTYVHLLNASGGLIASNDDYSGEGKCTSTLNSYLKMTNLAAGTYYVVSEGYSQNGNITTTIQGTVQKIEYDLGSKSGSFTYTHTQNTASCPNSYTGQSSNDVFYKFTTTTTMDVVISHCGSALSDTYVHLLNASGTRIAYNDDYSGEGKCSTTTQSYLKSTGLAPGTYYVVSEGYSQNGNITTKIEGIIPNAGMGVGSTNQNYIHTRTYTNEAGTTYMDQVQYFDGLGRPVQTVQKAITPGTDVSARKDLVTLQEYDAFGREDKAWLPAVVSGNNGAYVTPETVKANAITSNSSDQKPYSYPLYEASPLSRIVKQFGPGAGWQNTTNEKAVLTAYQTNIAGNATLNCKLYIAGGTNQNPTLSQTTNYATGQLYVTEIKDEDGNTSYEFKDKLGQVVLTRQMDGTTPLDTYYVYNDFGNQCFVLPPRIQDEGITQAKLNELAYQYKYDTRNRCIAKKIPGCGWISYIYDKADRLIFTQDGVQYNKSPKEWTFTIPDAFGRVVLTGICKDTINVSNKVVKGVYASTGSYKRYNIQVDGVNKTFTNTPSILSVNFYDNYDFRGMAEIPAGGTEYNAETGYGTWYGTDYTEANKYKNRGMLTGTLTGQMNADGTVSTTYLYSVMYYDTKKQLIQTKSNNHLQGGIEKEYIAYNFTGQPTQRKHIHQTTGKNTQTEVYVYTYDHAGRLLKTTHQLTDGTTVKPQVTLAENTYDDLGRLKTNKKGGVAGTLATYTYNVRSWTKSITGSLFTENLYYNESYGGNVPRYNGNITAMNWTIQGETVPRGYAFAYDNLSRLTGANYLLNGSAPATNDYKVENIVYDKHGNIKNLKRYGKTSSGATYALVDNLTMAYSGNQLVHVADAITNPTYAESADFKDKVFATGTIEYTYTANGAMNKDLNKGISEIQYNSLNLLRQMVINSPTAKAKNYYTYSASGVKLRTEQRYDPNYTVTPSNATNPANDGLADYMNRDYAGNIIYETVKNGSAITNRTRILVDGGYYEGGMYYYYLTDHLGNNRVVVNQSGTVTQKSHYYPFGTAFADKYDNGTNQPYKYNGKELDGMHQLNLYDYSARYYESALGRFTSVDPLAEKFYSWSPYSYAFNNPLRFIDPTGMSPEDGTDDDKLIKYYQNLGYNVKNINDVKTIISTQEKLQDAYSSLHRAQSSLETATHVSNLASELTQNEALASLSISVYNGLSSLSEKDLAKYIDNPELMKEKIQEYVNSYGNSLAKDGSVPQTATQKEVDAARNELLGRLSDAKDAAVIIANTNPYVKKATTTFNIAAKTTKAAFQQKVNMHQRQVNTAQSVLSKYYIYGAIPNGGHFGGGGTGRSF